MGTTRKKLGRWFALPWYPIVFGAYPVLFLLAQNIGEVKADAGLRPALASVILAVALFGVLFLILRNVFRTAFLCTLLSALFFSYGHTYVFLLEKYSNINRPWFAGSWLALAIFFCWWATRPGTSFVETAKTLNVISLGLVIVSVVQINPGVPERSAHALGAENAPVQELMSPKNPPDIYYFVLDMYTREDLLKRAYHYDNSDFVKGLEARGFYVASCSQSNYTRTELSVASTLNMSYLQDLDPRFNDPQSSARQRLWDSLKHSAVRYNLEQLGYKTISYPTGYAWSELEDANVFMSPPPLSSGLTEFEALFLQTTLLREAKDLPWLNADQILAQNYRDRHMLVFNSMKDVTRMAGPKFVYVHLIMPHPPFVFGPNGEYTNPADFWNDQKIYSASKFEKGYINQLTFLNRKVLQTVDTILSESSSPPIIILQGDHGPWIQPNPQHFMILNAYYLPGHETELYPTISPVNSFRLVFNDYFGGKYDMLADVSYYSPVPKLYKYSKVPYPCQ